MDIQKTIAAFTVIIGCSLAMADVANAGFIIRISDGLSTTTVMDNGVGDLDSSIFGQSVDGVIMVSHRFEWGYLDFTAGVSKPAIGGADNPTMHLTSLRLTSKMPHPEDLVIEITDTDFTGAPGGLSPALFSTSVGGLAADAVSFSTFVDDSNQEFGYSQQLGGDYQFTNTEKPAFSDQWYASANLGPPFSLTMRAVITHQSEGITSFSAELQAVPEPATWIAWLGFLTMVAGVAIRRRKTFT